MRGIGGPLALLSIWALTTVPAGFSVYILRTIFTERWPGSAAGAAVESLPGTLLIWLAVTAAFTAWGCAQSWRRA
ncbi:MAG TPA: hypothetical protein VFX49_09415 [Chloroflexota bacterium]|nr:hypothetical protein [Chloroflexota bacterium]